MSGESFTVQEQFFALIRLAIGRQPVSFFLKVQMCWAKIYELAKMHALSGICFAGIEKLPESVRPETGILLRWIAAAECIRQDNELTDIRIRELVSRLRADNFEPVLLKGRGLAALYDAPLADSSGFGHLGELRSSGDIDVWIPGHSRKEILRYLRATSDSRYVVYHNAEYPVFGDVQVEVHFVPSWFWDFRHNRRFQRFCAENASACLANVIDGLGFRSAVPTPGFNRVFVLQHIYRHLFAEGIGLRQLLDYYFVLSSDKTGLTESYSVIMHLGMGKFCAAVMWIMKTVFRLDDDALLCRPDEKEGRLILSEIMKAGNFGQYCKSSNYRVQKSAFGRFSHHVMRAWRYVRSYPGEVLCIPIWKIWHFVWRKQFK